MSSRNIAIQKAVYDALMREKRPGESFTGLLRRLMDQREGLEELYGSWVERRTATPAGQARPREPRGRSAR